MENNKTEEQIREEVKAEFEREAKIKEQAKQELEEQQRQQELKEYNKVTRKKRIGKIIYNIIVTIILVVAIFETAVGILDMQRLNDDKEPVWYIDMKEEQKDNAKITTYNLGLYNIKKSVSNEKIQISLAPFFMDVD